MIRTITFIMFTVTCFAHASVTKVGNGDDGADLEDLTPITGGLIYEARGDALTLLKDLNVRGIPGLGGLTAEVAQAPLLMAANNAHPTGENQNSPEVSGDHQLVYARTFAEPHAAVRFFPAATKLSRTQLIALHIHEALHRALPADVRENEDAVMHMTMAITSPGASFDRTAQAASLYLTQQAPRTDPEALPRLVAKVPAAEPAYLPDPSRSKFALAYESYQSYGGGNASSKYQGEWKGLEYGTSLGGYNQLSRFTFEPYLRARLKVYGGLGVDYVRPGPSSLDLALRTRRDRGVLSSVFGRFTAKSFDVTSQFGFDRDVTTMGLSRDWQGYRGYYDLQASYSLASRVDSFSFSRGSEYVYGSRTIKPIFSIGAKGGWAWKKWRMGGLSEMHMAAGAQGQQSELINYQGQEFYSLNSNYRLPPFRLLVLGPELGYETDHLQVKAFYKAVFNSTFANLTDLGDVMDRGAGFSGFGLSVGALF